MASSLKEVKYAPNARSSKDWQRALEKHLAVLDAICHEHDIVYYLAFGGLLGAVRHRGFIPWDNDVDIVLDERNYNKLVELDKKGLLPDGYRFIDRNTEEGYPLLFGRFVNTQTSCPLSTSSFNGGTHGIFVDAFILFPLPNNAADRELAITKFLVWEQLLCYVKCRSNNRSDLFLEEWSKIEDFEKTNGHDGALAKIEREFRMLLPAFEDAEWCLHGSGGGYRGFPLLKRECFDSTIRLPFESIELDAPAGYQLFLESRYGGSWRQLPKGEKFKPYSCSNLSIPGNVVSADYMQCLDSGKADWAFRENTHLEIELMRAEHRQYTATACMRADLYGRMIEDSIADKATISTFSSLASIPKQTRESANEAIGELADVFRYQNNRNFSKWHVAIRFNPELLTAALWAKFIADEDYWSIRKVISLQQGDPDRNSFVESEANKTLIQCLDACTGLYNAIDENDAPSILETQRVLNKYCPHGIHAKVSKAYSLQKDPARCIAYLESLNDVDRCNDYIRALRAASYLRGDQQDVAAILFSNLADSTSNGMIYFRCMDMLKQIPTTSGDETHEIQDFENVTMPRKKPAKMKWPRLRDFGLRGLLTIAKNMPKSNVQDSHTIDQLKASLKQSADYIATCRRTRRLTSDRISTWETMYPRKKLIADALAKEDVRELRKLMNPYLNAIYRLYDNDNLGIYLDSQLLDAARGLVIEDRGEEFFNDYLSKIPEPHRVDIDVWLKSQNVAHPYFD